MIKNPWNGCIENSASQRTTLHFGTSCTGIFRLTVQIDDKETPISGIEWIRNHYEIIEVEAEQRSPQINSGINQDGLLRKIQIKFHDVTILRENLGFLHL